MSIFLRSCALLLGTLSTLSALAAEEEPDAALAPKEPAAQSPPTAPARPTLGWNGLHVADAQGRFGLKFHMLLQARGSVVVPSQGEVSSAAGAFRARPFVRFHAWQRRLSISLQTELVGQARLLDARVDITPVPGLRIAGGQLIVPFTRAWNTPLPLVQAPERSLNNSVLAPGRRFGAYVHGKPAAGLVELWLGGFAPGAPADTPEEGVRAPMGLARLQINPLGELPATETPSLAGPAPTRLGLGLAALASPVAPEGGGRDRLQVTSTADFGFQARGFTAYGEGFLQWTQDAPVGWGASGSLAQFLVPRHLALIARGTAIDLDVGDGAGARVTLEPALGGYIVGNHLVIELRYAAAIGGEQAAAHAVTVHTQAFF